jgi:DNA repair protein RadC
MVEEIKHYYGHRDRLKKKFREKGGNAFSDYELLELVLFQTIPRKDVKPLAKELIAKFGSLAETIATPIHALESIKGISTNTAISIKLINDCSIKLSSEKIMQKQILQNWQQVLNYCHSTMAWEKEEHFRILFLNKKNILIGEDLQGKGTIDHTPVYPREIVKKSLEVGATAVILVHNHPSGNNEPSREDILMTKEIKKVLEGVSISLHDHIIISKSGHFSFKSNLLI